MTSDDSRRWSVTDNSDPEPWRDGSEVIEIRSEEHLVSLLRIHAEKDPRIFTLKGPITGIAFIGIGGPFTGIRYYPNLPSSRCLSATPGIRHTDEEQWFTAVGEPSGFAANHVMPVEELIHVVDHLYRTGELDSMEMSMGGRLRWSLNANHISSPATSPPSLEFLRRAGNKTPGWRIYIVDSVRM